LNLFGLEGWKSLRLTTTIPSKMINSNLLLGVPQEIATFL